MPIEHNYDVVNRFPATQDNSQLLNPFLRPDGTEAPVPTSWNNILPIQQGMTPPQVAMGEHLRNPPVVGYQDGQYMPGFVAGMAYPTWNVTPGNRVIDVENQGRIPFEAGRFPSEQSNSAHVGFPGTVPTDNPMGSLFAGQPQQPQSANPLMNPIRKFARGGDVESRPLAHEGPMSQGDNFARSIGSQYFSGGHGMSYDLVDPSRGSFWPGEIRRERDGRNVGSRNQELDENPIGRRLRNRNLPWRQLERGDPRYNQGGPIPMQDGGDLSNFGNPNFKGIPRKVRLGNGQIVDVLDLNPGGGGLGEGANPADTPPPGAGGPSTSNPTTQRPGRLPPNVSGPFSMEQPWFPRQGIGYGPLYNAPQPGFNAIERWNSRNSDEEYINDVALPLTWSTDTPWLPNNAQLQRNPTNPNLASWVGANYPNPRGAGMGSALNIPWQRNMRPLDPNDPDVQPTNEVGGSGISDSNGDVWQWAPGSPQTDHAPPASVPSRVPQGITSLVPGSRPLPEQDTGNPLLQGVLGGAAFGLGSLLGRRYGGQVGLGHGKGTRRGLPSVSGMLNKMRRGSATRLAGLPRRVNQIGSI